MADERREAALGKLVHDVNGACGHLKSAAALLRGEDSKDELELLRLMVEKARSLADAVASYEGQRLRETRG